MSQSNRSALRAELRARRRALPPRERILAGEQVAQRLRPLLGAGYVAGYWACDGELPLHALLNGPTEFVYCLPCLHADRSLGFAPWRAGDPLQPNRYGIPEPTLAPASQLSASDLQVILLPLLGFTRSGQRLGTGGGYYDRSLAFCLRPDRPATPRLIGVGYACQELEQCPAEPWDVPLDLIVTERGLIQPGSVGGEWDL